MFRRHCDSAVLTYQTARMPEQIRLKVGGISSAQFSVYDEFARNIPGFQPMTERDAALLLQKTTVAPVSFSNGSSAFFKNNFSNGIVHLFSFYFIYHFVAGRRYAGSSSIH